MRHSATVGLISGDVLWSGMYLWYDITGLMVEAFEI